MKYNKAMLTGTYTEEDFVFFWRNTPQQTERLEEACRATCSATGQ